MQKLLGAFGGLGLEKNAALFDKIGYSPGMFWGALPGCTELIGGVLLVLGLFTPPAASGVVIFMINGVYPRPKPAADGRFGCCAGRPPRLPPKHEGQFA